MTVTVRLDGPIFDGRAVRAMQEFGEALQEDLGRQGIEHLTDGTRVFRYVGGKRTSFAPWRSRLRSRRMGPSTVISNPAVYTAWLEGVSSRNQTTRFKGYRLFRKTGQFLRDRAQETADRVFGPFRARMQ